LSQVFFFSFAFSRARTPQIITAITRQKSCISAALKAYFVAVALVKPGIPLLYCRRRQVFFRQ
jgi:hypothetical protein